MGYLIGYTCEGGYRVWTPRIGLKRLVTVPFTKGLRPCYPTMGPPPRSNATGSKLCTYRKQHLDPRHQHLHTPAPQGAADVSEDNDEKNAALAAMQPARQKILRPGTQMVSSYTRASPTVESLYTVKGVMPAWLISSSYTFLPPDAPEWHQFSVYRTRTSASRIITTGK